MNALARTTLLMFVCACVACLRPRDALIANLARVPDSLMVAVQRGPGTSGRINDLLGKEWKGVSVFDAQSARDAASATFQGAAAKAFSKQLHRDSLGAIVVFRFFHGATQAVFVSQDRVRMAPQVFGQEFSNYATFAVDSAGRIVIRR